MEIIAGSVTKENLPYLYRSCYIFPTKRAALYFTRYLEKKFAEEAFILPETLTIQDFIAQYAPFSIKEDWDLLLDLYKIQNTLTGSRQPLEKFLPWGKMILKDFDECDKYLVPVQELFSVLKAQKAIDDSFQLSEETRRYIEQFLVTASAREKDKEHQFSEAFVKTWSLLGEIHQALQKQLSEEHAAYEGMAYRAVYEALKTAQLKLPYDKIVFCGFNALSVCEEHIFEIIGKQYTTEYWWDADAHFMDNPLHEAGNFLRAYQKKFSGPNSHWISGKQLTEGKEIRIRGISSDIGQAQYAVQELATENSGNTAIVLCNEQLLQPLLYMADSSKVNITMGYSISNSELYLYTQLLLNLYCHARREKGQTDYYHKDIAALAAHSYVRPSLNDAEKLEMILPFFVPFMPADILKEFLPETLLPAAEDSPAILRNVIRILRSMEGKGTYFISVREVILDQLERLLNSFDERKLELHADALPFLIKMQLSSLKVPFETNTESRIQIMGFLETRILDFDELFILSLNDDNLPGTNKTNSFIPYNLRKGFGLPTFEQFDGINAYHFYRLLKRARRIHLLYNNQVGDNTSEKSRFIRQIQHDLDNSANRITESIALPKEEEVQLSAPARLQVKKTEAMIQKLRKRAFSPSALKVYLKCPLQFYLKYIEDIREPEETEEEIDAAVFGLILHKTLELIYSPHLHARLDSQSIRSFSATAFLREKMKEACEALQLPREILIGSNKLQLKIIERIVQKILDNDAANAPLQVLHTEEKFIWDLLPLDDGSFATLQGTFDRIDKVGKHAVRIVDYKTGKIDLPDFPDMDDPEKVNEFLDALFSFGKKDLSAAFQGILYALMYYKLYDCHEIYVAYHHAKKMKEGLSYLNQQQAIPVALLLQFEQRLSSLLSDIIYREEWFLQNGEEDAYRYSPYADLLGMH